MTNEIKLTAQDLEQLKDDNYFRGVVVTKLAQIEKRLDQGNGTIATLVKKTTRHETNIRIHWFLISMILVGIASIAWRSMMQ